MMLCVLYDDPRHPEAKMTLCVDDEEVIPALKYGWSTSINLTTAFKDEADARRNGIDKCGQGEFLPDGRRVLFIKPHPDKRKRNLKSISPPKFS